MSSQRRGRLVPARLVIRTRDLDTYATTREETPVEAPTDEAGQRAQLDIAVRRRHPRARPKSFGDGVASYLEGATLIVAHYDWVVVGERPATSPTAQAPAAGEPPAERDEAVQPGLFAA